MRLYDYQELLGILQAALKAETPTSAKKEIRRALRKVKSLGITWAVTQWCVDDVIGVAKENEIEISPKDAQAWLERRENAIEEAAVRGGFDAIYALLPFWEEDVKCN